MRTALVADPIFREHLAGHSGHPERPERYDAVVRSLEKSGLIRDLTTIASRSATEDELRLCHTLEYLRIARRDIESGVPYLSTGDTDIGPKSWEAAACAVGGVLSAVDAVITGAAQNAFCAVRPPGHHANAARGMGFCLFNNVALAAEFAIRELGARRVCVLDWDVHHGNGTAEAFRRRGMR